MGWRAGDAPPFKRPSVPWTPASEPGLTEWLNDSGITGVNALTNWKDASGLHNDFNQPAGTTPPSIAPFHNGKRGVTFDGLTQYVETTVASSLIYTNDLEFHVFLIAQQNGDTGSNANYVFNPGLFVDLGNVVGIYGRTSAGPVDVLQLGVQDATPTRHTLPTGVAPPFVRGVPTVVEYWKNPGDDVIHLKNAGGTTVTLAMGNIHINRAAMTTMAMGRSPSGGLFPGTVGEVFAYDHALSAPVQALAQGYMTAQWAEPA